MATTKRHAVQHDDVPPKEEASHLTFSMAVAADAISTVGTDRIEVVTLTRGRITLQPTVLADGETIARMLGLDFPLDHRMPVPGHTLWSGARDGLEVQVRSTLRTPAAW